MTSQEIIKEIQALWSDSGATIRGIACDANVSPNSVSKASKGKPVNHSTASAIHAALLRKVRSNNAA